MRKLVATALLTAIVILSGCTNETAWTPEEVINKALEAEKEITAYQAEGYIKVYEGDKLIENSTFKEFSDPSGPKMRMETQEGEGVTSIVVNDGKEVVVYMSDRDEAYTIEASESNDMNSATNRELLLNLLEQVRESHTIETAGNEELAGVEVIHIVAAPKEKNTLLGHIEMWVDQKTWQVMKSLNVTGDIKSEMEYTSFDRSPVFDENTFVLELPEHVTKVPMESLSQPNLITLEEARTTLNHPFLYWDESEDFTLDSIEHYEMGGELNRSEVSLNYAQDGIAYMLLSVFAAPEEDQDLFAGAEEITVRGVKGNYLEQIRYLSWDEDGMRYSLGLQHPDLTLEEALKLADEMVLHK